MREISNHPIADTANTHDDLWLTLVPLNLPAEAIDRNSQRLITATPAFAPGLRSNLFMGDWLAKMLKQERNDSFLNGREVNDAPIHVQHPCGEIETDGVWYGCHGTEILTACNKVRGRVASPRVASPRFG